MSGLRPVPAPCVVLGIDSAATSGWARGAPRAHRFALDASGTCRTACQRRDVVTAAIARAAEMRVPLVVVAEDWAPHGMTPRTFGGLREAFGRWAEHLDLAALPVVRVMPNRWRGALGLRASGSDAWKRAAQLAVRARFGIEATADQAEAVCIAVYGAHSDEVLVELGRLEKRRGVA